MREVGCRNVAPSRPKQQGPFAFSETRPRGERDSQVTATQPPSNSEVGTCAGTTRGYDDVRSVHIPRCMCGHINKANGHMIEVPVHRQQTRVIAKTPTRIRQSIHMLGGEEGRIGGE